VACTASVPVRAQQTGPSAASFSPRLTTPRVAPLTTEQRSPEQQRMLANRPDFNIYKTLAHNVQLYDRWTPLGRFLLNGTSLPPREREIVILRMGWLCQSEYEWSQHARIGQAKDVGLSAPEIQRIALGAAAPGWSKFDRTLLTMVDELRYDTKISDATWAALRARYSLEQTLEALFTAAQYQLVSMALNSLGVQLDPMLQDRLPTAEKPMLAALPDSPRLAKPRLAPLPETQWSKEQRRLITPVLNDGKVMNLYATLLHHPALYGPRRQFGSYLQRESRLGMRPRELLIMRTAWSIQCEYEWAHHVEYAKQAGLTDADIARIAAGPAATGWTEHDAALLQAVDELRREAFITDTTWRTLAKHYDTQQLIEIVFTVGGYTMTGLAINSLGIQVEPAYPRMPRA
jgi:alkylhydroperoxidase family enzyme